MRVADAFDLVDSPAIAAAIAERLARAAGEPPTRLLLTPPVHYSLAKGVADNRAMDDAQRAAILGGNARMLVGLS